MNAEQKSEIMEKAEKAGVKFIRLQFTDLHGVLKNMAVTVEQLGKTLDGELMFDGSSVTGFTAIEKSDLYLRPDPATFSLFPWRPRQGAVARLICEAYKPDGTPFEGCPRFILKKVMAEAAEMNYTMNVGPELEFFLFHLDESGDNTLKTHDRAGYFDLAPMDMGEDARRSMVLTLEEMGFEIEASHHEVAPGQHEIDFKYSNALDIADKIVTFKFVVRTIARRHGLHATFMPKPVFGINGSGMHLNQSLFREGENIFHDPANPMQLSKEAYHYMGGLIRHGRAITAVTNPTVNSYKRLVPGYEAPVYIAWSSRNRSPLVRVPAKRGMSTRVELRNPDPSCNPYLALAVCLKAGLDGIKNKIEPPPPCNRNIYAMDNRERESLGIGRLPVNLAEALDELSKNKVICDAIGPQVAKKYIETKKAEWEQYRLQVHQWEIKEYMNKY